MDNKPEVITLPERIKKKYRQVKMERIYRYPSMLDSYVDYAKNSSTRKFFLGIPTIDKLLYGIKPPEVVTIIASQNTGKTALAMHALDYNVENNQMLKEKLLVLFSLEMSQNDLIKREIQRMYNMYSHEAERRLREDTEQTFYNDIKGKLLKYNNIVSVIKRVSPYELMEYIKAIEEIMEQDVGAVMFDYIQLIEGDANKSDTRIISDGMKQIKEIAIQLDIPFIVTSQVSRSEAKSEEGLSVFSGKSAGEIENSSQIVLALENVPSDKIASKFGKKAYEESKAQRVEFKKLTILKKKEGFFGKVYLRFDTKNLSLTEYSKPPDTSFAHDLSEPRTNENDEEKPF